MSHLYFFNKNTRFFEHEGYIKVNTLSRGLMIHDTFSPTSSLTFDLIGRASHYFGTKNDYRLGFHYSLKPTNTIFLVFLRNRF